MKAAIYFATGFEEVEALSVVDVLRRGDVDITMVGVDGMSVMGSHRMCINMDTTLDKVDHREIDMMILPGGGLGTKNLKANKVINAQLKQFKEEGKWLAAICAAPSVLGQAGLLQGEKAICYPGFENQLIGAEVVNDKVVVSHHIVTAVGAGAALEFGFKLLEIIKGKETSDSVRKAMIAD